MYQCYTMVLSHMNTVCPQLVEVCQAWSGQPVRNSFTTSIICLNNAIVKLAQLSPMGMEYYRAFRRVRLPRRFFDSGRKGLPGACEPATFSPVVDEDTALRLAGASDQGRDAPATVMHFRYNRDAPRPHCRPALLSWLSQYPAVNQFVCPPLGFMEVVAADRVEGTLRLRMNLLFDLKPVGVDHTIMQFVVDGQEMPVVAGLRKARAQNSSSVAAADVELKFSAALGVFRASHPFGGIARHMNVTREAQYRHLLGGEASIVSEVEKHGTEIEKEYLDYILNRTAGSSDIKCPNGTRDYGRPPWSFDDFCSCPEARNA